MFCACAKECVMGVVVETLFFEVSIVKKLRLGVWGGRTAAEREPPVREARRVNSFKELQKPGILEGYVVSAPSSVQHVGGEGDESVHGNADQGLRNVLFVLGLMRLRRAWR